MDEVRLKQPTRSLKFFDIEQAQLQEARQELEAGLLAEQPYICPKFFYDTLGSKLFEAICELPEYSLTRTEAALLQTHVPDLVLAAGKGGTLIDLGAGNCQKAEKLFTYLKPVQYVAIDIAADFLLHSAIGVQQRHPNLEVVGLNGDFTHNLVLPALVRREQRLFFYPGSSLGNFTSEQALRFLKEIRRQCEHDSVLLLGLELVREAEKLVAAYDDALGVTAAFNKNVLLRCNQLLGTNFYLPDWQHVALFNAQQSRIEMHLEAVREVEVRWSDGVKRFKSKERIHTENSHKYSLEAALNLLALAGFKAVPFVDPKQEFALFTARPM